VSHRRLDNDVSAPVLDTNQEVATMRVCQE
jgi:hypothetical protein